MYLELLNLFFNFVQVLLVILMVFLVIPFIHYFIFGFIYYAIGRFFGLQPYEVARYIGVLFFPGTFLKLMVRAAIIPILGGRSGTNLGMNFQGVWANTWVDFDGRLSREAVFIFSPYILLLLEIPLAVFFSQIVELLSYNGINILFSMILVGYLMVSIIVTGLPIPQDVYSFFALFTRNHPLAFFMFLGITFNSLLLVPSLGLDLASTFAFFQLVAYLVIEVRTNRILSILRNPDEFPEDFMDLVDLGVI
ncbi:MAG: hypothetical protein D6732_04065 [Methanobacteriota archaeon]|nr:MAG: hypothetical protein D6732_04065 [Euryarchaeota archaeon]